MNTNEITRGEIARRVAFLNRRVSVVKAVAEGIVFAAFAVAFMILCAVA